MQVIACFNVLESDDISICHELSFTSVLVSWLDYKVHSFGTFFCQSDIITGFIELSTSFCSLNKVTTIIMDQNYLFSVCNLFTGSLSCIDNIIRSLLSKFFLQLYKARLLRFFCSTGCNSFLFCVILVLLIFYLLSFLGFHIAFVFLQNIIGHLWLDLKHKVSHVPVACEAVFLTNLNEEARFCKSTSER